MKIKHIIFDWSGTLCDDHRLSYLATRDTVRHFSGKNISFADYKKNFTLPASRFYRGRIKGVAFAKINACYFKTFTRYALKSKLFPGVKKLLVACQKKKIKVSILSTVDQDLLEQLLIKNGIKKYFFKVCGSVIDKRHDLKDLIKKAEVKAGQTVFIGDTDHDVDAGKMHGVISAAVLNGYQHKERLLACRPRLVFSSVADMLGLVIHQNRKIPQRKPPERPLATVGALILNRKKEGLFVLTHKWGFTYGIPGGKIDRGETAVDALRREMREETGLEVRVGDLIMSQDCINSEEFYIPKSHMILMNWVVTTPRENVKLNDEALGFIWLKPSLALNLRLNEPTRMLVENYLRKK